MIGPLLLYGFKRLKGFSGQWPLQLYRLPLVGCKSYGGCQRHAGCPDRVYAHNASEVLCHWVCNTIASLILNFAVLVCYAALCYRWKIKTVPKMRSTIKFTP